MSDDDRKDIEEISDLDKNDDRLNRFDRDHRDDRIDRDDRDDRIDRDHRDDRIDRDDRDDRMNKDDKIDRMGRDDKIDRMGRYDLPQFRPTEPNITDTEPKTVYDNILDNHSIKGEKGSQYVVFTLSESQSIVGPANNIYTKNNIKTEYNATLRNMKYTGVSESIVAFGCNYQNSILYFKVMKGSVYYVPKYNVVAYTDNITFENDMALKCLPDASGDYGYAWIASYGSYEKMELKDQETVLLNAGMLVMSTSLPVLESDSSMYYKLSGPCNFILQSKNIKYIYKQNATGSPNTPSSSPSINPDKPSAMKKGFFASLFSGGAYPPEKIQIIDKTTSLKSIRATTRNI